MTAEAGKTPCWVIQYEGKEIGTVFADENTKCAALSFEPAIGADLTEEALEAVLESMYQIRVELP